MTIVAVSNSVAPADETDDRARSRMGNAPEIFFNAYAKNDVVSMLQERAKAALIEGAIDQEAIEYCAERCSQEHGDARRAIGLLRAAAEVAGAKGDRRIAKGHVDEAAARLEMDRVTSILRASSYNLQMACCGLARAAYLPPELEWYATSTLYRQYCRCMPKNAEPLGYRRVSDLLGELENLGLVVSRAVSRGKHGYGKQYRLTVEPDIVGRCFAEFWAELAEDAEFRQAQIQDYENLAKSIAIYEPERIKNRYRARDARIAWKRFVDL